MLACSSEILRIAQTAAAGGGLAAIGGAWREALLKALDSATRASYPQAWIFQGRCAHKEFEFTLLLRSRPIGVASQTLRIL